MSQLYKNIKNRRIELNMTQSDLAEKMGYADKSMIAKIEKGQVDLQQSKIELFAKALVTTYGELVGCNEEDPSLQKRETNLEDIETFLATTGHSLGCESYYDDCFFIKDSSGRTIASLYDYELLPKYDFLKKNGTLTIERLLTAKFPLSLGEQSFMEKYRDLDPHGKEMVDFTLQKEWERSISEKEKQSSNSESTRLISYYYRLASAGTGQILFDMPPTKRIEIPDIPEYRKADYAIGVNGDSMEPVYHDGDMLLVEMTEEIKIGEIGIFSLDGDCYVKKLGEGELISLNPKYSNISLNETAKCMGRVIDKLT